MNLKSKILSLALQLGGENNFNFAFDFRALFNSSDTSALLELSKDLWKKIKVHNPEILVSKGMGGYPLLIAIKILAYNEGIDLATLIVRDKRKDRGVFKKIVEGPSPEQLGDKKVAVYVDDIIHKGRTYLQTKETIFEEGYDLDFVSVAVVLDFWDYSRQLLAQGKNFDYLYKRHDLGITRVDHNLPTILDNLKWRLHLHHTGLDYMPVKSWPVIHDQRIFVGNDNTAFYCYDVNNGDLLWRIDSANPQRKGTVCVAQFLDDNVYCTSYDGTVRSINYKTGQQNWSVKADLNLHSAVAVDKDRRRLFLGTEWDKRSPWYGRGDIISLDADTGKELWRTPTKNMIPATPYYSKKHNQVFCGSNDFHIYILDADTGSVINQIPTKGEVKGKIAANNTEDVFVGVTIYGHAYGFTADGKVLWTRNIGHRSLHPYPLIWDNSVFVTNNGGHVVSIDIHTGNINWVCKLRGSVGWGVQSIGDCILALTTEGYIAIINRHTGEKIAVDYIHRTASVKGIISYQPPAFDGENLVIVSNNKGILTYKLNKKDYELN